MGLPGCLFVCHLILLLVCFLFNCNIMSLGSVTGYQTKCCWIQFFTKFFCLFGTKCVLAYYLFGIRKAIWYWIQPWTSLLSV